MSTTAPSWEREQDGVKAHYSSLTLHRKCPQAFYYRYELNLKADRAEIAAPERDFGAWWSAMRAAEALERGRAFESLRGELKTFSPVDDGPKFDMKTVTTEDIFEAADIWWKGQSMDARALWDERLGEGLPDRLRGSFSRWMDRWSEERKNERPIAVEAFWKRALPRPAGDSEWDSASNAVNMYLIGFIDEIYEDVEKGITVVRDGKTSKSLATQSAADEMMDSQLALYAWGIAPKLATWGVKPIRGLAYDRMKSVKPKEPKLTLTGTLSKSVTQYDLQTYLDWVATEPTYPGRKKDGSDGGTYEVEQKVIDQLSTPAWQSGFHQRSLVPLSKHVVRAHLRAAVDTATDIWRTERRAELTGEAARNFSDSNCRFCDYAKLCRAQMIGGPDGTYELKEFELKHAKDKTITFLGDAWMPQTSAVSPEEG